MVEPRFFMVEDLDDLIEQAEYVRTVLYKVEEYENDISHWTILAGRFYWEGDIDETIPIYHKLLNLIQRKGVRVKKALDLNTVAGRF